MATLENFQLSDIYQMKIFLEIFPKPQEARVWLGDVPLVPEDVETDLQAEVTATHQVGHSEEG